MLSEHSRSPDRFSGSYPGPQPGPAKRARVFTDAAGIEWEAYDESSATVALALDWDYLPQLENPGLIFTSRLGLRRLWPCPTDWATMPDEELVALVARARSIF